jgi:hypothetical protein
VAGGRAGAVVLVPLLLTTVLVAVLPVAGAFGIAVLVALLAPPQPPSVTAHTTAASAKRRPGVAARRMVIG